MAEPIVVVDRVTKIIRQQTIVREASLVAEQGEALALCGPNGAGKSTLIRMIAGIAQPTHGTVTVAGYSWKRNRREYARQIGYMPDDYRFGNRLSARESLAFWAALRGVPNRRVDELLEEVGLAEAARKPASSLSKGMRQRLLFAQALLARPPVLVLDEPTNGLDPYWLETFVRLVRAVKAAGHTVIFSTHQLEVAEALADRTVLIDRGVVRNANASALSLRSFFQPAVDVDP